MYSVRFVNDRLLEMSITSKVKRQKGQFIGMSLLERLIVGKSICQVKRWSDKLSLLTKKQLIGRLIIRKANPQRSIIRKGIRKVNCEKGQMSGRSIVMKGFRQESQLLERPIVREVSCLKGVTKVKCQKGLMLGRPIVREVNSQRGQLLGRSIIRKVRCKEGQLSSVREVNCHEGQLSYRSIVRKVICQGDRLSVRQFTFRSNVKMVACY